MDVHTGAGSGEEAPQYAVAHLRRALAEDPRVCELGIHVTLRGPVWC